MVSKRFLEKMDATEFEKNVFKSYLKQRDEHLIKSNTSVVLDDDNLKYLKKLAQTHKCSLTDVVNIILKEKIIQLEIFEKNNDDFESSISTIVLEELLKLSKNNSKLEEEIFKEKLLIIDSFDLSKKVVLIPSNETNILDEK